MSNPFLLPLFSPLSFSLLPYSFSVVPCQELSRNPLVMKDNIQGFAIKAVKFSREVHKVGKEMKLELEVMIGGELVFP